MSAIPSKLRFLSRGSDLQSVFNIFCLSSTVGNGTNFNLSILPGRNNAGSIISGLFVAARTNTPSLPSTPSNSVNKVLTTRCVASDLESSLLGQSASISSKNIRQGADALALENTILTAFSLSPTYLFNSSGPFTETKLHPHALAVAFASKVLPQPGGPHSKIPVGFFIPNCAYNSLFIIGSRTELFISLIKCS
eukprot:NODE_65_length_25825_cov_1.353844.p14 type:complete len:194 gc:universal NODE_65_length_25825_cov_1.353844:19500-18919(-)